MPVSTRGSAKRARDDSDLSGEERAAKRPTTPFFRRVEPSFHERARSAKKATPARVGQRIRPYSAAPGIRFRDAGFEDLPQLMPTGEDDQPPPAQVQSTPATPQQRPEQSTTGWLWNSVIKYIPGLRGQEEEPATPTHHANDRSASPSPSDDMAARFRALEELRMNPQRLPPPEPVPELDTYQRLTRMRKQTMEDFDPVKRNKRFDFASKAVEREERSAERSAAGFNTKKVPGSNKRKITDEPAEPSTPPRNTFQVPSVEDDDHEDVQQAITQLDDAEVLLKTPEKQLHVAPTPLKSAMRTGTKSRLNVGFDETTIKSIAEPEPKSTWRDYGPAGHYTGTTFLDPMDPKNKKHFQKFNDDKCPVTNHDPRFTAPNTFGIADEDLEYTLTPEEEAQLEAQEAAEAALAATPPTAPRPAHAELPAGPKQAETVTHDANSTSAANASSQSLKPSDSQKTLDEQRARANKYKPKKSSGLSHVEPARSRSSSPPRGDSTTATAPGDELPALSDDNGDASNSDESSSPTSPTPPSTQPLASGIGSTLNTAPIVLDDTKVGEDGMTDYGREHQYDAWAAGLAWPEPQTYVEVGVCSAYIDDLLRKKWTKEDERITREWWQKEFADVDRQMEAAKRNGQKLELVFGDEMKQVA
jgi:hypothetical protein